MIEITTPIGRAVQGFIGLREQRDDDDKVKRDDQGNPIKAFFMALAIEKSNPEYPAFYAALYNEARASFPNLVGADGAINHPQFSFKIIDGDGVDANGKRNSEKTGFAGHWVIRLTTQFMPAFFRSGQYDPMAQLQDPAQACKIGDYFRARVTIKGNGWQPGSKGKPGVYVNPSLLSIEGFGDPISGQPDAREAFQQQAGYRPAGMSTTPTGGSALPPPPGSQGAPAPGGTGLPPPPGGASAGGLPPPPGAQQNASLPPPPGGAGGALPSPPQQSQPQYTMTAQAQGATREQLIGNGWSDEALIQHGYMTKNW